MHLSKMNPLATNLWIMNVLQTLSLIQKNLTTVRDTVPLFVSMKRRGMNVSLVQSKKGFSDLLPKESLKSFQMDLF